MLRLLSRLFASIFLSKRFIELVKLFEARLLELLTLPVGFDACRYGDTLELFPFRSFDDSVSLSYNDDLFVTGFFVLFVLFIAGLLK